MSEPRLICGGSPQGSILGNYLFCITTDGLGQDDAGHGPPSQAVQPVNGTPLALRRNRSRVGTDFGRMVTDDGLDGLGNVEDVDGYDSCLLYTSPSPRDS